MELFIRKSSSGEQIDVIGCNKWFSFIQDRTPKDPKTIEGGIGDNMPHFDLD